MDRCDAGHPHAPFLVRAGHTLRGERDPHWSCSDGEHGLVEVFDDGEVVEL